MKNKILGWWMCLASKFIKLSYIKQFVIYSILFIVPLLVAVIVADSSISVMVVAYLICMYAFFVGGFRMVNHANNGND